MWLSKFSRRECFVVVLGRPDGVVTTCTNRYNRSGCTVVVVAGCLCVVFACVCCYLVYNEKREFFFLCGIFLGLVSNETKFWLATVILGFCWHACPSRWHSRQDIQSPTLAMQRRTLSSEQAKTPTLQRERFRSSSLAMTTVALSTPMSVCRRAFRSRSPVGI